MKKILIVSIFTLFSSAALAINVSPVHLAVEGHAKNISLTLSNESDAPATIDVRAFQWTGQNADGVDILAPTDALVLSRPVVNVSAHSSSTIRIIIKDRTGAAEDAYRVIVKDITPPPPDGTVGLRLTSVLPLFVLNNKSSKGDLELQDGVLKNTGTRHVRISSFVNKNGEQINLLRYLMPSQSIVLPVESTADVVFTDDIY